MKKNREFYLKQLKYYKGEKENPFKSGDKRLLWFYEQVWFIDTTTNKDNLHAEYITELASARLLDLPDNMPIGYKALLFNAYRKTSSSTIFEDAKEFRKFYLEYYEGAE